MNARTTLPLTEATTTAPGHGGGCACGETSGEAPELDVRVIPHAIRHATVFGAWSAIPGGGSLIIVAPHDPKPLLAQLAEQGPLTVTYLDEGPDAWRLKLTRA
ncbi:MAG: DUF2249 domain-containing protein [Ornithinibacter sp.]